MAREGVTYDQVAAAADRIVGAGQAATIKAVREELGNTGSPNTIHRHLTAWREARPVVAGMARDLPVKIIDAITTEIEQASASARADIEVQLIQARTESSDLASAGEALETERDALLLQVAELTSERDRLTGQTEEQAMEIGRLVADLERERTVAEQGRIQIAQEHLRAEANEKTLAAQTEEITRLRSSLEAERDARIKAEQSAAVLTAKLEACATRTTEMHEREQQASTRASEAEKQVQILSRDLATERIAVQACQARLEAAARELTDAKQTASEARDAAKVATETAAELRGRLAALSPTPKTKGTPSGS